MKLCLHLRVEILAVNYDFIAKLFISKVIRLTILFTISFQKDRSMT